jgi:hypothetical protein
MRRVRDQRDLHDEQHVRRNAMRQPEQKITMNEGAAYWARITGTPRPHRGTLIRWAIKGVRGKRLRAEPLAGRWYTTTDAIEEFLRHVTQPPECAVDRIAGPARTAQVQRALDDLDAVIAPKRRGRSKSATV